MQKKMKIYKPNTKNNNPYLSDPEIERILAKLDLREELGTNFYAIEQHELDGDEVANKHKNKIVSLDEMRSYYEAQKKKTLDMLYAKEIDEKRRQERIALARKIARENKETERSQNDITHKLSKRWDELVRNKPTPLHEQLEKRFMAFMQDAPEEYRHFRHTIISSEIINAASNMANRICRDACRKMAEEKEKEPGEQEQLYSYLMQTILGSKKSNTKYFENMLIKNTSQTSKGVVVHWKYLETALRYFFEWRIACFI